MRDGYFHAGCTPSYLLRLKAETGKKLSSYFTGNHSCEEEIEKKLREDAANGIIYPVGHCDNWDERKGCQGHKV